MMEAVSYRVEGGVAWLTIERPEARNALNAAVREGLWAGGANANPRRTCANGAGVAPHGHAAARRNRVGPDRRLPRNRRVRPQV